MVTNIRTEGLKPLKVDQDTGAKIFLTGYDDESEGEYYLVETANSGENFTVRVEPLEDRGLECLKTVTILPGLEVSDNPYFYTNAIMEILEMTADDERDTKFSVLIPREVLHTAEGLILDKRHPVISGSISANYEVSIVDILVKPTSKRETRSGL